jgi:hypothetical protein
MGATATHPYRYETLFDGTVTASLAMPIHRDVDRLVSTMIEVLRDVYAVPAGTDLAASVKHAEETNSWRFSDERYVYWVVPLPVDSEQIERLSLRRLNSP